MRLLSILAALSFATSAHAYQKFEEYRIGGSEIASVTSADPSETEAPYTMTITLTDGRQKLEFESDDDLADCKATIENAVGDRNSYVAVIVDVNSQTINGTLVTSCQAYPALNTDF
ncbi:MAG: hypothetical protein AAGF29_05645 [Pseudomonadota bacterium]